MVCSVQTMGRIMNAKRRKALEVIHTALLAAVEQLEQVQDDEQEAFDNLPESFQQGDKGATMQEGLDTMQSARDELENVIDYIATARGE